MSGTAVTALVFDAAPAQQGAAQFDAAGQRIVSTNNEVVAATTRTIDAQAGMERALARLTRQIDPVAAAQAKMEAGQRLLDRAFQRGSITAEEQARSLTLLESRYALAQTAANRLVTSNDNVGRGFGRLGGAVGQAGFQLQDFVVQVGAGQSALVALGQQGSQLLGVFGTGGAIAGAVLALAAMSAQFLVGKSAAEQLTEALEQQDRAYQDTLKEAERMESALKRQNSQFVSAAEAGNRYRSGLQGMGEDLVRLARYYERLTEVQRENERVTLGVQQRALTAGGGTLQQEILRPIQGRISTAEGGLNFDMSGMMGQLNSLSTSLENIPEDLRSVTQAAIAFRDSGRVTGEGFQQLINAVALAKAGSIEYRSELEALEKRYIDMLPRVREYEEALRRLGIAQTAINPSNAGQVALEAMRGVTSEVGGNYQTRQRILDQRRRIQAGLGSGLSTAEDRLAARSSLQSLAQQEQGLTPATTQQLRALDEQARLSRVAEGAARDLASAEMELDRAARAAGLGQASAAQKVEARRLVQERLIQSLNNSLIVLNAQITGEQRIAQAYGTSAAAGREMEARVRAEAEALKTAEENTTLYAQVVATLTTRYQALSQAQAERQQALRNSQAQDDLAYAEREQQLIGATAEARERELAVFKSRQEAARNGITGSQEAAEQERLALALVNVRQNSEQLRNSWNELSGFFDRTFDKIGTAITEAFAQGKISAINFGSIAKAVMSEVVQSVMKLAVINPILNSLFGGSRGTLGGIGQVAGLTGGGGQIPIQDANGGITGYIGQASSASSLYRNLGGFNPGSMMTGAYNWNTGYGFADSVLNTSVWGTSGATQAAATNSALGSMGGTYGIEGMYGPAAPGAVEAAGGSLSGAGGQTIGSLGAGALGVAGGLYGIYSGIQKGGVGGGFGVAGGAATAGLSAAAMAGMAVPIYGWIAAAVLTIIGALLPGQKASGKGQEFRSDLFGNTDVNGLTGDRYSPQNAEQARNAVNGIVSLAQQVGDKLGGVRFGDEIAVGVTSGRKEGDAGDLYLDIGGRKGQYSNDEAGAKQLADQAGKFILEAFKSVAQGDYAAILNSSASDSLENLQKNLDWYESVYKSFEETSTAASAFELSLKAVRDQYQVIINKAGELGLSYDKVIAKRDEEIAVLQKQRDTQVAVITETLAMRDALASSSPAFEQIGRLSEIAQWRSWTSEVDALTKQLTDLGETAEQVAAQVAILQRAQGNEYWKNFADTMAADDQNVITRILRATGRSAQADLIEFEAAAKAQVEALMQKLAQWPLTAEQYAGKIASLEEALGAERLQITQRVADEQKAILEEQLRQGQGIRDYLNGLTTQTGAGGVSAADALTAAQGQFGSDLAAARAGDADAFGRITNTADRLLAASRAVYASSPEYQAMRGWVINSLGTLPGVNYTGATSGGDAQALIGELRALRAEVTRLQQIVTAVGEAQIEQGDQQVSLLQQQADAAILEAAAPKKAA